MRSGILIFDSLIIDVLIPAYNEENAIALVIADLPKHLIRQIVVCDNGSTDGTAQKAKEAGAVVVSEPKRGYGSACLAGMGHIAQDPPDIVVFIDGDYSDYPEELPLVLAPILENKADIVIGSRALGGAAPDALTFPQRFGNALASKLLKWFYGASFTDLGPFRAIRYTTLMQLKMEDPNFGWTVELQIKAAQQKITCTEVSVRYRKRAAGKSKVSGNIIGSIRAGHKILYLLFKSRFL